MIDVVEILQHWHAGRPKLVLSASLGVDPKTVRKYVAPAEAEGIVPGDGLVLDRAGWAARVAVWFPELTDARARSATWPVLEARRELIESMLATNTVATVHQRLRDEHDVRVSVTSLRRYVWQTLPDRRGGAQPTVLRPDVPAGLEAQIDYGYLGRWLDPLAGRIRRVWAFVVVLACSRHMFVRPVLSMDSSAWVAAHVAAWEFFGGVPARLVIDNLKTGVIKADLYDPKLNRAFAEMAAHYGCLIDPARAAKPKDKPRVERMMPYVRDSYWRGRTFGSVADMQVRAVDWALGIAGTRAHRSLDGGAPLTLFRAVEAPALLGLPGEPFELARWLSPRVAPDCHLLTELSPLFVQFSDPLPALSLMRSWMSPRRIWPSWSCLKSVVWSPQAGGPIPTGSLIRTGMQSMGSVLTCGICWRQAARTPRPVPTGLICCAGFGSCGPSGLAGIRRPALRPATSAVGCRWRASRNARTGAMKGRPRLAGGPFMENGRTRRQCARTARRCCAISTTSTATWAAGRS